MKEFMMLMKGPGQNGDWQTYIESLIESGLFRGGSVLGNGVCHSQTGMHTNPSITGFMRFEANDISDVQRLVAGNPDFESGGEIEILELVRD